MSTLAEPTPPRWYVGYIAGVYVIALLGLAAGVLGLYLNSQSAARQVECFQTFADKFSNVSTEVRAAQVKVDRIEADVDNAAAKRDAAFQDVLVLILSESDDREAGLRAFTALTDANATLVEKRAALVAARNDLATVRREHPIPQAPDTDSGRCKLLD